MSSQLQKTFDIIVSPSGSAFKGSRLLEQQPLKVVLENYLKYYGSGDTHTARAKRYDLNHFLSFLSEGQNSPEDVLLSDWTAQSTKDFVDSRLQSGEAPATVSRRLATLKHLGRTLAERFHGYINPAREIKGPVLHLTPPHGLDSEEIRLLTEAAAEYVKQKEFSFVAQRNAFLLELLLATGLRADEVRLLTMGQISENFEWLKNVKTKGRKYRNVYLDRDIRERLGDYLKLRAAEFLKRLAGSDGPRFPLLVSFYGVSTQDPHSFGLSPKTIWRTIAHFGKLAQGLAEKDIGSLHPHRLRHTFAHGLLESSRDVRLVAQALGHSDVRTTMRYTERTDEEVARAIEEKKAVEEKQLRRR